VRGVHDSTDVISGRGDANCKEQRLFATRGNANDCKQAGRPAGEQNINNGDRNNRGCVLYTFVYVNFRIDRCVLAAREQSGKYR